MGCGARRCLLVVTLVLAGCPQVIQPTTDDGDLGLHGRPPGRLLRLVVTGPAGPLARGATAALRATGDFDHTPGADATALVAWSTSDPALGTIDDAGRLTAHAEGTVTVTAALDGLAAVLDVEV